MLCIGRLAPFQRAVSHGFQVKSQLPAKAWDTLGSPSATITAYQQSSKPCTRMAMQRPRAEPVLSVHFVDHHIYGLGQSERLNGAIRLRGIDPVAEKRTFLTSPVVDATSKFWYNAAYVIA